MNKSFTLKHSFPVVHCGYYGETVTQQHVIQSHKGLSARKLEEWLYKRDMFRRTCRHTHDCCGCWHGGINSVRRISRSKHLVETMYSLNV